jgi:hypothetical protein
VGGEESQVVFGQTFAGEKGNISRCLALAEPVPSSPNFAARSSHILMHNSHSIMRN